MNNHEELTDREKELFQELHQPVEIHPGVEERLVQKLKNTGLIKDTKSKLMNWTIGIAAAVALLATGAFMGRYLINVAPNAEPSYNYMLVLYEDEAFSVGDPEALFNEYSAWMQQVYQKGITIDGQEMKPVSVIIEAEGQNHQPDKKVGGYFVLKASSLDEVIAIAKDSPHLKYGGTIEVKEFMIRN
ncbi:hypothetical protein C900_03286 [Fulvivirga imtechensis AK7]|uniref:YCII-related domain-containing protein n=1 Tax=Fulvivirga imtechensis AK7 TaxID=1237149 RepID=L8JPH0_9BACT|nr:YciI family protein [Fulvivirga imtechensis]ELR70851.1 hypothetical protein C900_03286 [Fulvivirga imtechensis AK7]